MSSLWVSSRRECHPSFAAAPDLQLNDDNRSSRGGQSDSGCQAVESCGPQSSQTIRLRAHAVPALSELVPHAGVLVLALR
eukprot:359555-Chlamydomonas_euryale.AAC.7